MLRQVTNGLRGLHNPQCPLLHSACITCFSTSTSSSGLREEQQLAAAIADRLSSKAPESAASALVEGLSTQQRTVLLKALGRDADAERVPGAYVDKLFKEVDTRGPFQQLDK